MNYIENSNKNLVLFQKKEIENAKELSDTVVLLKNGSDRKSVV